jgi:pyrroloquinoline-quinone synthase
MPSVVERIDEEIARKSLLKHPFYKAWSEGKLNLAQLAGYSVEYFQLVKQVPKMVENVHLLATDQKLSEEISQNLREEREHIVPWIKFANSLGINEDELLRYSGALNSREAVSQLEALTNLSFEEAVAAMYAYEMELPKISRSKIDGLKKFYGLDSHNATYYFEIHEIADIKHADLWRGVLRNLPTDKTESAIVAARKSLEAQNKLLDSVFERYCG